MENTTLNREGWLTEFATRVAPIIKQRTGLTVPMDKVRLSCSFPRTRATPNRSGGFTSGQCFHGATHASGLHEIMINPIRSKMIEECRTPDGKVEKRGICETVIHELLHAALPSDTMHKAPFARAAKKMGLEGKPTSTTLGPEAEKIVLDIIEQIGQPYPHEALDGTWGRKQGTRLIKVSCPDCGYINERGDGYTTRITMMWIEVGLPTCPCGQQLEVTDKNVDVDVVALTPVESSATYRVPGVENEKGKIIDANRFQIRRVSSEHFGETWTVLDFGPEHDEDGKLRIGADARIVSVESKGDALELIEFVRAGTFTWDQIEADRAETFEDEDDLMKLDEDDYADEFAKGLFHDVDEDEAPDYPEDQTPDVWVHPRTGREVIFNYDEVAASRES